MSAGCWTVLSPEELRKCIEQVIMSSDQVGDLSSEARRSQTRRRRETMNYSGWGIAATVLVGHLGLCSIAEAITWSIQNNGGTVVCNGSGGGTVNLPANCGADLQFISSGSGGVARIEAADSGANDSLRLVNTKILAQTTLTNYVLTFDHTFTPGPTSSDYTPIYYRTQMYGTYISGTAPANKITTASTVEHPVGTALLNVALQTAPPPQLNFNYYASPFTTTNMTQNRKIIVKVTFSLAIGKYVEFGTGKFIKVSAQTNPDVRDTPEDDESVVSLKDLQKILKEGRPVACMGITLPDGGCAGIEVKE
jgi:hypothetical protein